ncbi:MAG: 16S rRNA (uracil(1498)-N(3))-methyltransferase [Vicinamibacteria bacterium]|nr:16S rRNA (uracil(1498)-N(3))-methyltransferase [Vicinamibacteria bacterium]
MSRRRYYLPDASCGARLALPHNASHHARNVLRLRNGAVIGVFDGLGNEFEAVVDATERRRVWVRILTKLYAIRESRLRLVVALPPLKHDLTSLVVQKCTELGVHEIWPIVTVRTDTDGQVAMRGTRQERWRRIAVSAAEQCGRSVIPELQPVCHLSEMLSRPFEGVRLLCAKGGAPLSDVVPETPPAGVVFLVGPAGGLTDDESSHAVASGFVPVTLGPRLLRSETAVIVAAALCQNTWGDLRIPCDST